MLTKDELSQRMLNACTAVKDAESLLTDIDSRFGDADHGLTMTKVANAIEGAVEACDGSVKDLIDDAAMAVMAINGGSAVPLWNTWLDGMQEAAPEADEADETRIVAMFENALTELADISGAKVGEKTLMDAVVPATAAMAQAEQDGCDVAGLFDAAARGAAEGAEATKNFVAKYGRAKSYGEKTLGTPDAGALSMACFFEGLAQA